MADVRKATDLRGVAVKGSENKALLQWKCDSSHLDGFEVRWFYAAYGSATWRDGGTVSVSLPNKLNGWYHVEVTLPEAKAASRLFFKVTTRAKTRTRQVRDGTNSDGTAKYKTVYEPWFTAGTTDSAAFASPLYDATVKRAEAEYSKGEKADKSVDKVLGEIDGIQRTGANAHKLAVKFEKLVGLLDTSAKCYQAAYGYYGDAGYSVKTSAKMKSAKALSESRASDSAQADRDAKALEEDYAEYLEGLTEEKVDSRRASAKTYANHAAAAVKEARAYAKAGDDANEAKAWAAAKSAYEDSAAAWGKAYELSRASSDSEKRSEMNSKAQECERNRSDAADAAKAKAEEMAEKSARPTAPTLSVESLMNGKNRVTVNCSAKWSDWIVVERSTDRNNWAIVKDLSRTCPKDGGNWAARQFTDDVEDGKAYWYRAFAQRKATPSSSFSPYSTAVGVEGRPAVPTNFNAVKTDVEGQVLFTWKANGSVGEEYEIVYTDLTGKNAKGETVNAWLAGIPESEMHVYSVPFGQSRTTINGLAAGAWWFRLRLVGEGGKSGWAHRYDWTSASKTYTVKLTLREAADAKLTAPTALKATRNASSGLVTLTWADTLEDGASYVIQRSTNKNAWKKNIPSEVASTNYDGSMGKRYSFTDLQQGVDHYFRLIKQMGGKASKTATAAEGSSRYDDKTAFVKVPAPVAETVAAPTGLTAALSGTDAIVLKWTSAQAEGESYEIQHAATAAALSADDEGLITTVKLSQYTAKDAKQHTLTRLEAGSYAFRVRKVSASGAVSAWSNTATATVPEQVAAKLTSATGLHARFDEGSGTVQVRWSGILEADAAYEIWSTSNSAAFSANVMDAITVTPVGELASGGNTTYMYGFSNLERGKCWWFKLRKERGDEYTWGRAKAGDESFVDAQCVKVNVPAVPDPEVTTPTDLAVEARNTTSLRVSWSDPGAVGDKYIVQCTDDLQAYDDNAEGAITQLEMTLESASETHVYSVTGLNPGTSYAVRLRKAVGDAVGEWTESATADLPAEIEPDELAAPTVARLFSGYVDGDDVVLSWTHNSGSSSTQSAAQVSLQATDADGSTVSRTVEVEGAQNAISVPYQDMGAGGGWSVDATVRTQGAVEGAWSPWSAVQRFSLYRRPALGITLSDGDGDHVGGAEPFTRFPLTVEVQAMAEGGAELEAGNQPVSYTFELTAAREFPATAPDGTQTTVAAGQRVYSARADAGDEGFSASGWTFSVGAQDMRVADGAELTATASVVTAQGIRSEPQEASFTCSLGGEIPMPLAILEYRPGTMTATIAPLCTLPDDTVEEEMWGAPIGFSCTEAGYSAQRALDNGDGTATVEVEAPEGVEVLYVDGEPTNPVGDVFPVRLTVGATVGVVAEAGEAQVEMEMTLEGVQSDASEEPSEDGPEGGDALTPDEAQALADFEFEEVPEEADWEGALFPDEDAGFDPEGYELRADTVLAVYRVNADGSTVEVASGMPNDGQSACTDPHPSFGACTYRIVATDTQTGISSVGDAVLEVPEEDVVIQWGEQWSGDDYGEFQGERLVISRNDEAGEELSPKSSLADLAGREHPVAFYGRGSKQTYDVSGVIVPMLEADAMGAVRRLGSYGGNVYVRDPDGAGYWANVATARLSRARKTVGRSVSIALTRVEGGL